MRKLFGILLAGLIATTIGCENDPNYPNEPYIEFDELRFEATPDPAEFDELILSIKFRDGDNDLGLGYDDLSYTEPYHRINFFLVKDGNLYPVSTSVKTSTESTPRTFWPIISPAEGQSGKLATLQTRSEPGYDFMPEDIFPFSCMNYVEDNAYIELADLWMIDETYGIIDTINAVTPSLVVVSEKFYTEPNENRYNIIVDFLVEQPDGSFQEFDWRTQFCTTFDGRFPNTSKLHSGSFEQEPFSVKKYSRWEGRVTYTMKSNGFLTIFGGKKLKLRVHIKDRALHDSNLIETDVIQF